MTLKYPFLESMHLQMCVKMNTPVINKAVYLQKKLTGHISIRCG